MDDLRVLADRAKAGDRDAFGQLYARCQADVFAFVRRRVCNHHEAEDLVQEAFLRAWARMPAFEWVRGGFPAFVQMIARNLVVDLVKSARNQTTVPAPNDWEAFTTAADDSPLADWPTRPTPPRQPTKRHGCDRRSAG
jgi:RNA polymerase sigma factor (sigma-70 family)